MIIDVHSHFVPRELIDPFPDFEIARNGDGSEWLTYRGRPLGPMIPRLTETSILIEDMDRFGIDIRALATGSWLFCYWAGADLGERFAQATNDRMAKAVARHPDRLVGLATVPLQAPDRAIRELRRAVEQLGLRGVAVGTNVNGVYLDDPRFLPFLEAAQDLRVPIFFHPDEVAGADRLREYYLLRLIGNPHEAAVALSRMILSGALERLPRLRLCFPMAGGTVPYLLGRIEHGWRVRSEAHAKTMQPPSYFLRQCFFDTIAHSSDTLEFLLRFVPAGQVILGSDYPWDMGEPEPGQSVRGLEHLSEMDRRGILGENAFRLLGLEAGIARSPR